MSFKVSGYVRMSHSIYNQEEGPKFYGRIQPTDENDTGWLIVSLSDKTSGKILKDEDFVIIPFAEAAKIWCIITPIFNMPIGTNLQLVNNKHGIYFVCDETYKRIDIKKYLTLPIGSPIEMAFVEKKSFFGKLFSK